MTEQQAILMIVAMCGSAGAIGWLLAYAVRSGREAKQNLHGELIEDLVSKELSLARCNHDSWVVFGPPGSAVGRLAEHARWELAIIEAMQKITAIEDYRRREASRPDYEPPDTMTIPGQNQPAYFCHRCWRSFCGFKRRLDDRCNRCGDLLSSQQLGLNDPPLSPGDRSALVSMLHVRSVVKGHSEPEALQCRRCKGDAPPCFSRRWNDICIHCGQALHTRSGLLFGNYQVDSREGIK